jgi:hypothetical protein
VKCNKRLLQTGETLLPRGVLRRGAARSHQADSGGVFDYLEVNHLTEKPGFHNEVPEKRGFE